MSYRPTPEDWPLLAQLGALLALALLVLGGLLLLISSALAGVPTPHAAASDDLLSLGGWLVGIGVVALIATWFWSDR